MMLDLYFTTDHNVLSEIFRVFFLTEQLFNLLTPYQRNMELAAPQINAAQSWQFSVLIMRRVCSSLYQRCRVFQEIGDSMHS
jgi:hypothetical protein